VIGHRELLGDPVAVKRSELTDMQSERRGLDRHVRYCLTEVVEREFRKLPVGVLDESMRQVRDKQAGGWRPGSRAAGQMPDQARVL